MDPTTPITAPVHVEQGETPKRARKPREPRQPKPTQDEACPESSDGAAPKKTRIARPRATPEDVIAKLETKIQGLQENNKRLTDDNKTLRSAFTRMARIPKKPKTPAGADAV